MRPAVIVFAPLLLLPFLACESNLAGPEPAAAVTELQRPAAPTADAAFQLGPQFGGDWWDDKHGFGYGGPHQGAANEEDVSPEEVDTAADRDGQHTETQARTRKGDGTSTVQEATRGVEDRQQRRSKYGPH